MQQTKNQIEKMGLNFIKVRDDHNTEELHNNNFICGYTGGTFTM